MRALFVNHCHPDMPHVCALRMRKFAKAMALRGHQIVLLTEAQLDRKSRYVKGDMERAIKEHDWVEPLVVPIVPTLDPILISLRKKRIVLGLRQLVIFSKFLVRNGVFGDWRRGVREFSGEISKYFQPEIIWASFGNTDCWNIAQDLSRQNDCPWVADVKDSWNAFVPVGFRRLVARRFYDMAGITCFSGVHKVQVTHFFKRDAMVIYSGFPKISFKKTKLRSPKVIMITGSLYNSERAKVLIDGILSWFEKDPKIQNSVKIQYAGTDVELFNKVVLPLKGRCKIISANFMRLEKLRLLQSEAWINAYIYNEKSLFQHKPIELLSAGRPILAVPSENDEVFSIAKLVNVDLLACSTQESIALALDSFKTNSNSKIDLDQMNKYSWESQAEKLEKTLISVIGEK